MLASDSQQTFINIYDLEVCTGRNFRLCQRKTKVLKQLACPVAYYHVVLSIFHTLFAYDVSHVGDS
jgi:hypothetical protein